MNSEALDNAIENLEIRDVYLRRLNAECPEGFDPKFYPQLSELSLEFMHQVRQSAIVRAESEIFLKVFISLGIRWVEEDSEEKVEDSSDAESKLELDIKAIIEGELVAEYLMKKELSEEEVREFCLKNASYHVWPYWREIVQGSCAKMNLPKVVMQTVQFASNRD